MSINWGWEYSPQTPTLPNLAGWEDINEFATTILNEGLEIANSAIDSGVVAGELSTGDVDAIIFPDQIDGFDAGSVSFANAMAAFETYVNLLPAIPDTPEISEALTERPTLGDEPTMMEVVVNDFTSTSPVLDFGTTPEYVEVAVPSPPTIESAPIPDRPVITYPSLPTLTDVQIPSALALEIPTFTEIFVDDELTAPTNTFRYSELDYSSELLTAMKALLLSEMQTGGYGINPNDEAALWNRERDKETVGAQVLVEETKRNYGMTGFQLPPGALNRALEKVALEVSRKISSVNRDIAVKRSELYLEEKKFNITSSIQLEQTLIKLHSDKYERILNAAKAEMEVLIALFNAQVARYNAKVAKFKAMAEVFEAQIRAEIAKVELFKAQMEGARVQSEVQKNYVLLYSAQMDGVKNLIEAYKTDVEASNLILEREKIRMDVFKANVEAYSAQVAAQKYRFDAYESRIKGELGKVQAYEAEARAYAATVEGKKAQVEVNRLLLQQWTEENKALIDIYQLNLSENKEIRDIQTKLFDSEVNLYAAQGNLFNAKIQGLTKVYDLGQSALERDYRVRIATLSQNVETAKLQLQRLIGILEAESRIAVGEMDANSRVQSAAMNMINLNASVGNHFSRSMSESVSASESYNQSDSRQMVSSAAVGSYINRNINVRG